MPADQAEGVLVLGRGRILDPERAIGLQVLAQTPGLDRGQPVVDIVEQMHVPTQRLPRGGEQFGYDPQIFLGRPDALTRQIGIGGVVAPPPPGGAPGRCEPPPPALQTDCAKDPLPAAGRGGGRVLARGCVGWGLQQV